MVCPKAPLNELLKDFNLVFQWKIKQATFAVGVDCDFAQVSVVEELISKHSQVGIIEIAALCILQKDLAVRTYKVPITQQ